MMKIYVLLIFILSGGIVGPGWAQKSLQVKYRGIYADDPGGETGLYNPERGLRLEVAVDINRRRDVWKPEVFPGITDYLEEEIDRYRSDSISLVQSYFYLHGYIGRSLPEEAFRTMRIYFDKLREAGMKAVLRFAYETDFMGRASSGPTLEDVLRHMEQLKPFLAEQADVIAVVQAGFIGAWGEWHGSLHGLENSEQTQRTVLEKILWMTPGNRMVQVRVPAYKNLLNARGAAYRRTSFHDDFIIIDPHRWDGDMHEGTAYFKQMVQESPFLMIDGELPWGTWSVNQDKDNPEAGWIIDGLKTARQLFLQHYTSLSAIHNYKEKGAPDKYSMMYWKETVVPETFLRENRMPVSSGYFQKKDGSRVERSVFDYIRDHLGYRLELQGLEVKKKAGGKEAEVELQLMNRGFSALFNEHPVYLVLVDRKGKVTEFLTDADVHDWQPYRPADPDCKSLIHKVRKQLVWPSDIQAGEYELGLWIPDGSLRLKYNPRYAIRCANGDVEWRITPDGRYGINILGRLRLGEE